MSKIIYRVQLSDSPKLLADLYLANSDKVLGNFIFLAGLPSYMHKSNFAEYLSDMGYNIIQPFYFGSWVSMGDFTVKNCFETVYTTVQSIQTNKVLDLYNLEILDLKTDKIFLSGISFGTNVIQSLANYQSIEKVVLISTVPTFSNETNRKFDFDGSHFTQFLQRGFGNVYSSSDWENWEKEFNGMGHILNAVSELKIPSLLAVHGGRDSITPSLVQEHLTKSFDSLKFEILEGAGHHLSSMDEKKLADLVHNFLES